MIVATSRDFDLGRTFYQDDAHCVLCGRKLAPKSLARFCGSCAAKWHMTTSITDLPLTKNMRSALHLSAALCPLWGTVACTECQETIAEDCPALNGQPNMTCDECSTKCVCNGYASFVPSPDRDAHGRFITGHKDMRGGT